MQRNFRPCTAWQGVLKTSKELVLSQARDGEPVAGESIFWPAEGLPRAAVPFASGHAAMRPLYDLDVQVESGHVAPNGKQSCGLQSGFSSLVDSCGCLLCFAAATAYACELLKTTKRY
ncbi:unnamed protein product [Durusdinium trenchii]|uniref:Uncharacterized protein n=1 Tax=Durusdinium trenchii TaxID=1381693 RepID=A0ABP0JUC9_9DINO